MNIWANSTSLSRLDRTVFFRANGRWTVFHAAPLRAPESLLAAPRLSDLVLRGRLSCRRAGQHATRSTIRREVVVPPSRSSSSTQRAQRHGFIRGSSKTGTSQVSVALGLAPRVIGHCRLGCCRAWGGQAQTAGSQELARIAASGLASGLAAWDRDLHHQSMLRDFLLARQELRGPAGSPPTHPEINK